MTNCYSEHKIPFQKNILWKKDSGKRRIYLLPALYPFPTMFCEGSFHMVFNPLPHMPISAENKDMMLKILTNKDTIF